MGLQKYLNKKGKIGVGADQEGMAPAPEKYLGSGFETLLGSKSTMLMCCR